MSETVRLREKPKMIVKTPNPATAQSSIGPDRPRNGRCASITAMIAAPIPGLIATLSVSIGSKVAKGDKLLMMEAMKMQNTVYAPCDGVVAELHVALGDTVEAKDLLIKIRPAG